MATTRTRRPPKRRAGAGPVKATASPRGQSRLQNARVHGEVAVSSGGGAWERVYALVRAIPSGRVMTYGQIAALLGNVLSPKAVGWAMHACPDDVPWQRVVSALGGCATDRRGDLPPGLQRSLLEREGVEFRLDGTLDLALWRYEPTVRRVRVRR